AERGRGGDAPAGETMRNPRYARDETAGEQVEPLAGRGRIEAAPGAAPEFDEVADAQGRGAAQVDDAALDGGVGDVAEEAFGEAERVGLVGEGVVRQGPRALAV